MRIRPSRKCASYSSTERRKCCIPLRLAISEVRARPVEVEELMLHLDTNPFGPAKILVAR